jgi:hypothetical protein
MPPRMSPLVPRNSALDSISALPIALRSPLHILLDQIYDIGKKFYLIEKHIRQVFLYSRTKIDFHLCYTSQKETLIVIAMGRCQEKRATCCSFAWKSGGWTHES